MFANCTKITTFLENVPEKSIQKNYNLKTQITLLLMTFNLHNNFFFLFWKGKNMAFLKWKEFRFSEL